jgi:hypothetical protein
MAPRQTPAPGRTADSDPADILPWWHPGVLVREAWNLIFSVALGTGLGWLATELLALLVAAVAGGERADWTGLTLWPGGLFGLFTGAVTFLSYRMADRQ